MQISVVIVEDELEIRESLRILINGSQGYSCLCTFSDAESALEAIPSILPDVILMDIHLPKMSGISCMQELKSKGIESEFLMSTSFDDPETIYAALKAGASGYLTKTTTPVRILEAISEVHAGGSPMSSIIARKVVLHFQEKPVNQELDKLSKREQEIISLLSDGFRYKEVGAKLFISTETVRTHIRNIYSKLQVTSRTEAINKIKV
jgi:DNA-binding NarL/FixJ family response regulator